MTNEIKETLDYINDRIIPNEKWDKVKDYITNLEQENEIVKKDIETLKNNYNDLVKMSENKITNLDKENEDLKNYLKIMERARDTNINRFLDYKQRNEKAIDYIDSNDFIYDRQYKKKDKLENILTGGDE